MGYFTNVKTEEELKEQYRKLLIHYDYRSGKNDTIIEQIRDEYQSLLLQIKRGNGYRTTKEIIADGANSVIDEQRKANERKNQSIIRENQRISELKNHNYSKQELELLISKVHGIIDKILKDTVATKKSSYITISTQSDRLDSVHLCRWFNLHTYVFTSKDTIEKYDAEREKLEYAFKRMAKGDRKKEEAYMAALEKSIGDYIVKKLHELEDDYIDPIELSEKMVSNKKSNKSDVVFAKMVMSMVPLFFAGLVFVLTSVATVNPLMGIIAALVFHVLIGRIIYKKAVAWQLSLNKVTISTVGTNAKKSRVSEQKEYREEKTKFAIVRFLSHLIR